MAQTIEALLLTALAAAAEMACVGDTRRTVRRGQYSGRLGAVWRLHSMEMKNLVSGPPEIVEHWVCVAEAFGDRAAQDRGAPGPRPKGSAGSTDLVEDAGTGGLAEGRAEGTQHQKRQNGEEGEEVGKDGRREEADADMVDGTQQPPEKRQRGEGAGTDMVLVEGQEQ